MAVYAIEAIGTGRVKIGWAVSVARRLRQLQLLNGSELRVLREWPEWSQPHERALHKMFSAHRARGEWFDLEAIRETIMTIDKIEPKARPVKFVRPTNPPAWWGVSTGREDDTAAAFARRVEWLRTHPPETRPLIGISIERWVRESIHNPANTIAS